MVRPQKAKKKKMEYLCSNLLNPKWAHVNSTDYDLFEAFLCKFQLYLFSPELYQDNFFF